MPTKSLHVNLDTLDGLDYVGDPPPSEREIHVELGLPEILNIKETCSMAAEELGKRGPEKKRTLKDGSDVYVLRADLIPVGGDSGGVFVTERLISSIDSKRLSIPINPDQLKVAISYEQFLRGDTSNRVSHFGVSFAPTEQVNRWELLHGYTSGTHRDLYETNVNGALMQGLEVFLAVRGRIEDDTPQEIHIVEDELPAMMLFRELGFEPATPQDTELLDAILSSRYSIGTLDDSAEDTQFSRNWVVLDGDGQPVSVHLTKTVEPAVAYRKVLIDFGTDNLDEDDRFR